MKRTLIALSVAATAATLLVMPASGQNGAWQQGQQYDNAWNNRGWNDNGWNRTWNNNNYDNGWNNGYQRNGWNNGWRSIWNIGYGDNGWNTRGVRSNFGPDNPTNNSDVRFRANPNRSTEDLGYGRYEYCGW